MEREERKTHEEYEHMKAIHDAWEHDEIVAQIERERITMKGTHIEQVFSVLKAENKHFIEGLIEELKVVHKLIEYGADEYVAGFLDTPNMQVLSNKLEEKSAEFREAFLAEWHAWLDGSTKEEDEWVLGQMSVTDIVTELGEGYTREGFTIEEERFNKLMTRLCDAYYEDARTIKGRDERIRELEQALREEQNKTLIERIAGRWWSR